MAKTPTSPKDADQTDRTGPHLSDSEGASSERRPPADGPGPYDERSPEAPEADAVPEGAEKPGGTIPPDADDAAPRRESGAEPPADGADDAMSEPATETPDAPDPEDTLTTRDTGSYRAVPGAAGRGDPGDASAGPADPDPDPDPDFDAAHAERAATARAAADDRQAPPQPRRRSGAGFFALLLGGALAAVIGFGAARFVIPEGWPFGPVSQATRELTARLDTQADRLSDLQATQQQRRAEVSEEIAAARAAVADALTQTLDDRLAGLEERLVARLAELEGGIATLREDAAAARVTLAERITALERRPAEGGGASDAAVDSFEREVAELRSMLEEERARAAQEVEDARAAAEAAQAEAEARAAEARAEAERLAQTAARNRALADIGAALESGRGFAGALDALEEAGLSVPDDLRAAQDGVPTLEALQETFAAPARAALAAMAEDTPAPETGVAERMGNFLRAQFGVRSLAPRAGDDPDAILSRAQEAVRRGDLARALSEIGTLPEAGQAAMADWTARAEARVAATEAADTLAQQE